MVRVRRLALAVGIVAFVGTVVACGGGNRPKAGGTGKAESIKPSAASPELQAKRSAVIDGFQSKGYIGAIKSDGSMCKVTVGRKFKALPFKEKSDIAAVIFMWAFEYPAEGAKFEPGEFVVFRDENTGKDYATFDGTVGFKVE